MLDKINYNDWLTPPTETEQEIINTLNTIIDHLNSNNQISITQQSRIENIVLNQIAQIEGIIHIYMRHIRNEMEIWVISREYNSKILDRLSEISIEIFDKYGINYDMVYVGNSEVNYKYLPEFEVVVR